MQFQMNCGFSNTFENPTMMLAEDCTTVDSSPHQQLSHSTGTPADSGNSVQFLQFMTELEQLWQNDDMMPSHSTGALPDHGNSVQFMADLEQLLQNDDMTPFHSTGDLADDGNVMQTMDGLEPLNWELVGELHPTIQTTPASSTFDQPGEIEYHGNGMPNMADQEQLWQNDDMIPSHGVGALANDGNDVQNTAYLDQQNSEHSEEPHATIQTMPASSTFDQSGDQSGETEYHGNDMPNMADQEQLWQNDDMIRSHGVGALANDGNDMQNTAYLEQENSEHSEEPDPWIETMREIWTSDQSEDQSGDTNDMEADEEDDQEDPEEDGEDDQEDPEVDGECSENCANGATAVHPPRPVLPPGKQMGVSYHKKNKQWEAHLWLRGQQLRGRKKKGVQIFLGNFDMVNEAKQAHDRAAIKLEVRTTARGKPYPLNFPEADYARYMEEHSDWTPRDFLWKIRRTSNKFSKGKSSLKGVSVRRRATKRGQPPVLCYESKLSQTGKESGDDMKRTFMLGNFTSEEEAGRAYDQALLFLHRHLPEVEQLRCITNFRPSSYSVDEIEAMGSRLARYR